MVSLLNQSRSDHRLPLNKEPHTTTPCISYAPVQDLYQIGLGHVSRSGINLSVKGHRCSTDTSHVIARSSHASSNQQHIMAKLAHFITLNHDQPSIRLLRVLPEMPAGILQCKLEHATIDSSYVCFGYVWGTSDAEHEIHINGRDFYIRSNLKSFLLVAQRKYPLTPF
ncbi:hypothetical protein EK21DRAFT_85013 [Setomelanomma holmii]|uniref:Heterokaryon incompatibility domain-containing protein n=1 Tax=Setomelanomma holmii TaxID=210430 RepID=A0A9P4HKK8_9PLEO|nr:hypothetical protein EK21DRAFT_85013 [Setomelanomma holmii]